MMVVIRDTPSRPQRHEGAKRSPVPLSPEYLRAVEEIERHPDNQDGADKSWVWKALKRNRDHFARAIRKC
jgi:hypothetical protein